LLASFDRAEVRRGEAAAVGDRRGLGVEQADESGPRATTSPASSARGNRRFAFGVTIPVTLDTGPRRSQPKVMEED
jgi:hypothetical protein